jgi:hypothetical protein
MCKIFYQGWDIAGDAIEDWCRISWCNISSRWWRRRRGNTMDGQIITGNEPLRRGIPMVGGIASEGDFVEGHIDGSIVRGHGSRSRSRSRGWEGSTHLSKSCPQNTGREDIFHGGYQFPYIF